MRAGLLSSVCSAGFLLAGFASSAFADPAPSVRTLQAGVLTQSTMDANDPIIGDESHVEYFQVAARAGQLVRVTMESQAFPPLLIIGPFDDATGCDTCTYGSVDGGEGVGAATAVYLAPANGLVSIRTNTMSGGQTGAYSIKAEVVAAPRMRTRPLAYGATVTGSLDSTDAYDRATNRADAYSLRLRRGQSVQIDLGSDVEGFDPFLSLFGPGGANGELLAEDDDSGPGLFSRIRFTAPTSGTYQVQVRALSGQAAGAYTLQAGPIPPRPQAVEPVALSPGSRVTGALNQTSTIFDDAGDEIRAQVFAFMAEAGQVYTLGVTSSELDPVLELGSIDPETGDFTIIASDDDSGGEGTNARLQFRPPESGRYLFRVRAFDASTGFFEVSLDARPIPPAPAAGEPLASGSAVRATLDPDGPSTENSQSYRIYATELAAGETVRVRLNAVDEGLGFDPLLQIGQGTPAAFELLAEDDDGGQGFNSRIDFTAPSAGTYLIRAVALGGQMAGTFDLSVGPVPPPIAGAPPVAIVPGTDVQGTIDPNAPGQDPDADIIENIYAFEAREGQRFVITVNGVGMDAIVQARAEGSEGEWSYDDDSGGDLNSRLEYTVTQSGRQLVKVGALGAPEGSYTLAVTPVQ